MYEKIAKMDLKTLFIRSHGSHDGLSDQAFLFSSLAFMYKHRGLEASLSFAKQTKTRDGRGGFIPRLANNQSL